MRFDQRLKELRAEKDITQRELARALNIAGSTVAMYELGQRTPDADMLHRLASFFNCSIDYLLGRTDIRTPINNDTNTTAAAKISAALHEDPELLDFWVQMAEREDLQLMFKQVRDLSPETIRKLVRVIKAIEDEESE